MGGGERGRRERESERKENFSKESVRKQIKLKRILFKNLVENFRTGHLPFRSFEIQTGFITLRPEGGEKGGRNRERERVHFQNDFGNIYICIHIFENSYWNSF